MIVPPQQKDFFADVVLNHDRIDWTDLTLEPDQITQSMIGPVDHWDPAWTVPEAMEFERDILFDARRPNWGGVSKYGKPYYQHMLTLGKLMFPDVDITPVLADTVMFFCMCVGGGRRKILNLIGSQNAGKSFACSFLALIVMYIDVEASTVFISNPYDKSSESQEWGSLLVLWYKLVSAHPNKTGTGNHDSTRLFPHGKVYADRYIELIPGLPRAGKIELRGVKNEGKYRGTKGAHDDVTRGVILMIVGEINLIENFSFIDMTANLKSQPQYLALTNQNFKSALDLGGLITEPTGLFGGPSNFDDLDIERDIWWHSARSSITLRFDGHKSPNILLNRDIYPKLFTLENLQNQLELGVHHPDYFSQVRSFPVRGEEANSVLSRAKISASRHKDSFYSMQRITTRVAFLDPAFGGKDKARFGFAEFGTALVTDGAGDQHEEEIIVFREFFRSLRLVKGATYPGDDDYWKQRMENAGIPLVEFTDGSELSYEDQMAIQVREFCLEFHIPFSNVGYDHSLRHDIVSSMNKIIGFMTVAFDYNQGPEGVLIQNIRKNSQDCCKNRCTELGFLAADLFLTKQVRGGSFIEAAITQLSRTTYETENTKKYLIEGKREFKARHQGISPDDRDVLMGIAGMALKRGFRQAAAGQKSQPKGSSIWDRIVSDNIGRKKMKPGSR